MASFWHPGICRSKFRGPLLFGNSHRALCKAADSSLDLGKARQNLGANIGDKIVFSMP